MANREEKDGLRERVEKYIRRYRLLEGKGPVIVGVSGGADSVALLALLDRMGYACVVAHCNFHLRGEESDRDEAFVSALAARLGMPFRKMDFDTAAYAEANHLSIEMAARELRYDWFERERKATGARAIAVAHHRDDQVETVLLNLTRGTGLRGLRGMRPKNDWVIRPLLGESRASIEAWLAKEGLDYVTDSTNLSTDYSRNFIRLKVLPLLESRYPAVRKSIARAATDLLEVEELYDIALEESKGEVMFTDNEIWIDDLLDQPAPRTLLFEILKDYGFSREQSEQIFNSLHAESGKQFRSSTHRVVKDREYLMLIPLELEKENLAPVMIEGDLDGKILTSPFEMSFSLLSRETGWTIKKYAGVAYLDYDKIHGPLSLRHWRKGDWFIPFGMRGRKKLSDYFTDHKYNYFNKKNQWLLCDGEAIVWVVGKRIDNRYRVDEQTKKVLRIEISDDSW